MIFFYSFNWPTSEIKKPKNCVTIKVRASNSPVKKALICFICIDDIAQYRRLSVIVAHAPIRQNCILTQ